MSKMLVAVVDSTKARFLALEPVEFPEERRGSHLVELNSLTNPFNEAQGQDLWSSTKTGRNLGAGAQAHSYDDHRESHMVEFERRFAKAIATHIVNLVHKNTIQQLILVAEPQILRFIREAIAASALPHLQINESTKNLCNLKPPELQRYLAKQGLIPEPVRIPKW
ncbi:MAG: host attachment protein [Elainellaceae cyanobacterium]